MSLRCCFLSMDSLDGYVADDDLAIKPLNDLGWEVSTISWRDKTVDWNTFDVVVIRTAWDYQKTPEKFVAVLENIELSSAHLENSIDVVKWNVDKRYLLELEERSLRVVPTIWGGVYEQRSFYRWTADLGTDELIVKPTVSATADHTYRLTDFDPDLIEVFANRPFMVQPFLSSIVDEGEYSLFYLGGEYSHAIRKSPKPDDFRVQEEHGGIISAIEPVEKLRHAADKAFAMIDPSPLYARVDLVRDATDEFALMELELIEPALYLRMDEAAPGRFARAIDNVFQTLE